MSSTLVDRSRKALPRAAFTKCRHDRVREKFPTDSVAFSILYGCSSIRAPIRRSFGNYRARKVPLFVDSLCYIL